MNANMKFAKFAVFLLPLLFFWGTTMTVLYFKAIQPPFTTNERIDWNYELSIKFRDYCYRTEAMIPTHYDWEKFTKDFEWYALRFVNYSYEHEVSQGDGLDWWDFLQDPEYYDTQVKTAQELFDKLHKAK